MSGYKHLRVEEETEPKPVAQPRVVPIAQPRVEQPDAQAKDVDYWRAIAQKNAERLALAEAQAKDLREAADEGRGRFTKVKSRLDSANARINELQIALTRVSAERDAMKVKIGRQEFLRREVHAFRQSILDGHIWNIFSELCSDVSANAGEETKQS
jgi:hypothetical protein